MFKIGQIAFGTVWEVKDFGVMVGVSDAWGLLHRSNYPRSYKDKQSSYAKVNDVLPVIIQSDSSDKARMSFGLQKASFNACKVFETQFGTLRTSARIEKVESKEALLSLKLPLIELNSPLYGILPNTEYNKNGEVVDFTTVLRIGQTLEVEIIDYNRDLRVLICSHAKTLPRCWDDVEEWAKEACILKGKLTDICLNGIEVTVDEFGKFALLFNDIPGYKRDYEKYLPPIGSSIELTIWCDTSVHVDVKTEIFCEEKIKEYQKFDHFKQERPVILVGATGSGKSSVINAILDFAECTDVKRAKVGNIDPVTERITAYQCHGMTFVDSPGVGENEIADQKYTKLIQNWLKNNAALDPIVLVVLDGRVRDYGATFALLSNIKSFSNHFVAVVNKVDVMFPPGVFQKFLSSEVNQLDKEKGRAQIREKMKSIFNRLQQVIEKDTMSVKVMSSGILIDKKMIPAWNVKNLINSLNKI